MRREKRTERTGKRAGEREGHIMRESLGNRKRAGYDGACWGHMLVVSVAKSMRQEL
jgi:hypothetical protein